MGSVSFQPTADDLTAAYRAWYVWTVRRPRYRRFAGIGALGMVAMGGVVSVAAPRRERPLVIAAVLLTWLVVVIVLAGINWALVPRRARRIYRQQRALHDSVTLDWSAEAIRIATVRGEGRLAWDDFHARYEGRETILLLQSDALFNFIPKRVLTPEQAAEIMGPH